MKRWFQCGVAAPVPALLAALLSLAACHAKPQNAAEFGWERVQTLPHDVTAFTEGLVYENGHLFESTGINGASQLREEELESGKVLRQVPLAYDYFGEGLALLKGKLYQLTWQNGKGFIYDQASFKRLGEFAFSGEGWGLTTDGESLVMSDGTARIRFLDPQTFAVRRWLPVTLNGKPVVRLNELEWVQGKIWANVWQTDFLVRIDPATGVCDAFVNLKGLLPASERTPRTDVLNGIAYDAATDRLFVTGKYWPHLYQIRLEPKPNP